MKISLILPIIPKVLLSLKESISNKFWYYLNNGNQLRISFFFFFLRGIATDYRHPLSILQIILASRSYWTIFTALFMRTLGRCLYLLWTGNQSPISIECSLNVIFLYFILVLNYFSPNCLIIWSQRWIKTLSITEFLSNTDLLHNRW